MTHHNRSEIPLSGLYTTRRAFLQSSAAFIGTLSLGGPVWASEPRRYPIETPAVTTQERMLAFPATVTPGRDKAELHQVMRYKELGYGEWSYGSGLPIERRTDLMPAGYHKPTDAARKRLVKFFSFSDVHITDKEAPNQLLLFQQTEPAAASNTSVYSPVMLYSTQVLDAAIQTVNDLHRRDRFDFGIALGDACNSTSYNELRWYIDVFDGKPIVPSSGAHRGADHIDFQMPFQAAGLDKDLPWYQVLGNHDHFMIGSFPVDGDPSLGFRESYTSDKVWAIGSEMEWWLGDATASPDYKNAVDLAGLVKTLQDTPNLLMWIAGHRHLNVVKAFPSPDPSRPEQGFWQVETSSLRDFPQQFRTFEIYLNTDDTVSVEAVNVDVAATEGTPAAQARKYAIAAQQIVGHDKQVNAPNLATAASRGTHPIPSMDPTRPQSDDPKATDPTIRFVDLSTAPRPVAIHGSSNVELVKQLTPKMAEVLKRAMAERK